MAVAALLWGAVGAHAFPADGVLYCSSGFDQTAKLEFRNERAILTISKKVTRFSGHELLVGVDGIAIVEGDTGETADGAVAEAYVVKTGDAPASYPRSAEAQKVWLANRWPWIDVDLDRVHPNAFAACIPVLERLATLWPEPFTALTELKATPESSGWPDTSARAWYNGKGGIHLRQKRWSSPADGERRDYTLTHEFGHHIANWLSAEDSMQGVLERFISENFELGKKISDYATTAPGEAWAEGFEELHNRPECGMNILGAKRSSLRRGGRNNQGSGLATDLDPARS